MFSSRYVLPSALKMTASALWAFSINSFAPPPLPLQPQIGNIFEFISHARKHVKDREVFFGDAAVVGKYFFAAEKARLERISSMHVRVIKQLNRHRVFLADDM